MVARDNDDAAAIKEIWPHAVAVARQTGNPYLALVIDASRAIFTSELTPELVDHYEQLIPRLEEASMPPVLMASACQTYGAVRFSSGDIERGLRLTDTAVTYAVRAGYAVQALQTLCAPIYVLAGKADTAAVLLRRTLPINRDLGLTIAIAQGTAVVVLIAADHGDLATSAVLTRAARHQLTGLGIRGSRPANICLKKAEAIIADAHKDPSDAHALRELITVEETVDMAIAVLDRHHPTAVSG